MNDELLKIKKNLKNIDNEKQIEVIPLYPGIELFYLTFKSDSFSMQHKEMDQIMQINYCNSGQMVWKMENGNHLFLNPGDFSIHTMKACSNSVITFPTGYYSGITVCIDLQKAASQPPELLLKDTDIFRKTLREKFCPNNTISFLSGNEQTESIFSAFYNQSAALKLPYQKLKVLELFLYLSNLEFSPENQLTTYQSEQVEIIHEIHDRLTQQIGERITIDELSKQYLINTTTLKTAFKSVYGTSIAAHIKEHRMKQAAKMLLESDMSIAEIAQAVGYDSQSKFTAAFKTFFQILPREYRKNYKKTQ